MALLFREGPSAVLPSGGDRVMKCVDKIMTLAHDYLLQSERMSSGLTLNEFL